MLYLLLALPVGQLAIQCYTHAAYGEAVALFEQLQAIPEVRGHAMVVFEGMPEEQGRG